MAFTARCPDCKAKLRLDQKPDADENVECPKCGSLFLIGDQNTDQAPADKGVAKADKSEGSVATKKKNKVQKADKPVKSEKKAGKTKPAKGPKKRVVKKKKTNPAVLGTIVGVSVVLLSLVGFLAFYVFTKAGKVDEMFSYIPSDANIVRGMNIEQISKFKGFASEPDQFVTPNIRSATEELETKLGLGVGDLTNYVIIAKTKRTGQAASVVYVLRTSKSIPPTAFDAAGYTPSESNGMKYYKTTGRDFLNGGAVFNPTNKIIVIVPKSQFQDAAISAVASGGYKNKDNTFLGKVGATGLKISEGHNWCIVRSEGPLKSHFTDMGEAVKSSFPEFNKAVSSSSCVGWWTKYSGGGLFFGGAVDCGDSAGAKQLYNDMRNGELGKGDDADLRPDFKRVIGGSDKDRGEFLQYLSFNYTGSCAYFQTKTKVDKGRGFLSKFHTTGIADWDNDAPKSQGPGGGGGGRGPRGIGGG